MKTGLMRVCLLLLALSCISSLQAQGFGMRRQVRIPQNEPPLSELVVARWHFGTNGYIVQIPSYS